MEMKQWLVQHHGGALRIINDIIKFVLNITQIIVMLDFHFKHISPALYKD